MSFFMRRQNITFSDFYRDTFLAEHRHPGNIALHVFGTIISAVFVIAVFSASMPWFVLMYPIVHAAPGLIGHRLFERSASVGDVRVTRSDYSPVWFIAGNHRMTWDLVTKGFYWRADM
jgi:hypothetical protein